MKKTNFKDLKKLLALACGAIATMVSFSANTTQANTQYDGSFNVLTYNIASLPWPAYLSNDAGKPSGRVEHIGARLTPFDIVGVQEQFAYIDTFRQYTHHPFFSIEETLYSGGSGVDLLSKFPMSTTFRKTYDRHPFYVNKGFSKNTVTIYPGVYIDVYNTHTGDADNDATIIFDQLNELGDYITANTPADRAVIVIGDLNCHPIQSNHGLRPNLMTKCNLLDSREEAFQQYNTWNGSIDHILYRSGADIQLTLEHYEDITREAAPGAARFVNHFHKDGERLSDHNPAFANFNYVISANKKKQTGDTVYLSELKVDNTNNSVWFVNGPLGINQAIGEQPEGDGGKQNLNGVIYDYGLGVHTDSNLTFNVNQKYSSFTADVGVDEEVGSKGKKMRFQVYTDGTKVFDSGDMDPYSATQTVNININNVNSLQLKVLNVDGHNYDHADWANARFTVK